MFQVGDNVKFMGITLYGFSRYQVYTIADSDSIQFKVVDEFGGHQSFPQGIGSAIFELVPQSSPLPQQQQTSMDLSGLAKWEAEIQAKKAAIPPRCTCGAHAVGSSAHSSYCDLKDAQAAS